MASGRFIGHFIQKSDPVGTKTGVSPREFDGLTSRRTLQRNALNTTESLHSHLHVESTDHRILALSAHTCRFADSAVAGSFPPFFVTEICRVRFILLSHPVMRETPFFPSFSLPTSTTWNSRGGNSCDLRGNCSVMADKPDFVISFTNCKNSTLFYPQGGWRERTRNKPGVSAIVGRKVNETPTCQHTNPSTYQHGGSFILREYCVPCVAE